MTPTRNSDWRRDRTVLVTDAGTLAAIGVIRSLGRAGYRVIACAPDADALGLRSRFAAESLVSPPYASDTFLPWLRETATRYSIGLIIPLEMALLAMRPAHDEFASLLAYSPNADNVYRGLSKCDLFASLATRTDEASANLPATRVYSSSDPPPIASELATLGTPPFIKADAAYARSLEMSVTRRARNADDACTMIAELRKRFERVLVQSFAPGQGVGAFFLIRKGCVLAEFMHRRLHEVPHTGGISSLRESWRHDAIRADALAKLRALEWEGVAMMEYRWDSATDAFALMEMNGRFWGSLHLALHADVDFPRMLADAHFGVEVNEVHDWPLGVRCRHIFPWDMQHVWSRLKDRELPITAKMKSVLEFCALSLDPRIRSDLRFKGDRGLYWRNLLRSLPTMLQRTPQRKRTAADAHPPALKPQKLA
ncbi:MAG: hypothetical protein H6817_04335 [Phycisphaerales bacterium]|nr:hypothetical protein [Phycisphaerales bacterium]